VKSTNINQFKEAGFTEVHLSAQQEQVSELEYSGQDLFDLSYFSSATEEIRACQKAVNTQSP
jgi:hypothetical protein